MEGGGGDEPSIEVGIESGGGDAQPVGVARPRQGGRPLLPSLALSRSVERVGEDSGGPVAAPVEVADAPAGTCGQEGVERLERKEVGGESFDDVVNATAVRLLAGLRSPVVEATQEAVASGFERLTATLVQSISDALRSQFAADIDRAVSTSQPLTARLAHRGSGSLAPTRSLAVRTASPRGDRVAAQEGTLLASSDQDSGPSSEGSDALPKRGRSIRDIHDNLANRILVESGMAAASSGPYRRSSNMRLRGTPSENEVEVAEGPAPSSFTLSSLARTLRGSESSRPNRRGSADVISAFRARPALNRSRSGPTANCRGSDDSLATASAVEMKRQAEPEADVNGRGSWNALPGVTEGGHKRDNTTPQEVEAPRDSASLSPTGAGTACASISYGAASCAATPTAIGAKTPDTLSPCAFAERLDLRSRSDTDLRRSNSSACSGFQEPGVGKASTDGTVHTNSGSRTRVSSLVSAGGASSRHGGSRLMTNSQVLESRVNELTDIIPMEQNSPHGEAFEEISGEEEWIVRMERALRLCFRLGGILPWGRRTCTRLYKALVVSCLACVFVWTCAGLVAWRTDICFEQAFPSSWCRGTKGLVTEVLMSAAAVSLTSLLGIRAAGQQLDDLLSMLQGYAYNHDFSELWHRSALKDVGFTLAMFCAAAAMHMGEMPREDLLIDIHRLLRGCAIVVVMAMLMMCSMFLLYILRILVVTVDVFCYQSVQNPCIASATKRWNILQALLRKASTTVELGLLVLLALAAFTVPAFVMDSIEIGSYSKMLRLQLPHVFIVCGVLRVFVVASAVTDKCMRVPALLNSLCFGTGTELERQSLVEYIIYSDAGFYICDVRLTLGMVAKFVYVWFVILFSFVGRELAASAKGGNVPMF